MTDISDDPVALIIRLASMVTVVAESWRPPRTYAECQSKCRVFSPARWKVCRPPQHRFPRNVRIGEFWYQVEWTRGVPMQVYTGVRSRRRKIVWTARHGGNAAVAAAVHEMKTNAIRPQRGLF